MEKIKGYNRNLWGGKRRHKGISIFKTPPTLTERLIIESKRLTAYQIRVGQFKNDD